jgi:hypothetical protein
VSSRRLDLALVGYNAASSGNPLPTFRENISVPSSRIYSSWTSWPLKMGPIRCPETSVKDFHSTLRNTLEERRSHQHSDGSPKSRIVGDCYARWQLFLWSSQGERGYIFLSALQGPSLPIPTILLRISQIHGVNINWNFDVMVCVYSYNTNEQVNCKVCAAIRQSWLQSPLIGEWINVLCVRPASYVYRYILLNSALFLGLVHGRVLRTEYHFFENFTCSILRWHVSKACTQLNPL